jgi:hypothetical protein
MPVLQQPTQASAAPAGLPTLSHGVTRRVEPKVAASPPFWLVAYPDRWCVMAGEVVPLLCTFNLKHTQNGVQVFADGTIDVGSAQEHVRQKGGTIIPWDVDPEPYLVEAAPGSWVTRWTGLLPGSSHMSVDTDGYVAWIKSLQAREVLAYPEMRHLQTLASRLRFDLETSEQSGGQTYRTKQIAEKIACVERAIAAASTTTTTTKATATKAKLPRTKK